MRQPNHMDASALQLVPVDKNGVVSRILVVADPRHLQHAGNFIRRVTSARDLHGEGQLSPSSTRQVRWGPPVSSVRPGFCQRVPGSWQANARPCAQPAAPMGLRLAGRWRRQCAALNAHLGVVFEPPAGPQVKKVEPAAHLLAPGKHRSVNGAPAACQSFNVRRLERLCGK